MPPDLLAKSKPEFVSPLVLYLASDRCPETGGIYNAGMGFFNRAAVVTGPGAVVGGGKEIPSPEALVKKWDEVGSLEGARPFDHLNDLVGEVLGAFTKPADGGGADAGGAGGGAGVSVADIFGAMPDHFDAKAAAGVDVVFQYMIAGEGGGDWICAVKDGKCEIATGTHAKPACTLKMEAPDFLAMMTGKLPPMQAFTTGKLMIEGDVMKSQLIEKLFKM